MKISKAILAGTFFICAIELLFPPWRFSSSFNFQTFAFILSKERDRYLLSGMTDPAFIMWDVLALEIGATLLIGLGLLFLTRK